MNLELFICKQSMEGNMTDICVAEFRSAPVSNKEKNKASLWFWSKHMVQSHMKNRSWRFLVQFSTWQTLRKIGFKL